MPLPDVWGELLKNSVKAKFAFWGFSEVQLPLYGILRSSRARPELTFTGCLALCRCLARCIVHCGEGSQTSSTRTAYALGNE